jgi:hypothetical protein
MDPLNQAGPGAVGFEGFDPRFWIWMRPTEDLKLSTTQVKAAWESIGLIWAGQLRLFKFQGVTTEFPGSFDCFLT